MKPGFQKGRIVSWKDERGFGFIKPDHGSPEVFLHISALTAIVRRPRVGDRILYKITTERDGKIRATQASIQGVTRRSVSARRKPRKHGVFNTFMRILIVGIISLVIIELDYAFAPSRSASLIASITKPECIVEGNISYNGGRKLYHIPGMEDYQNTKIDSFEGERWFCSEEEAIANGWRKAPR